MAQQALPLKTRKKIYVYIGRFQPFHNAHAHVIERAAEKADLIIVLIGSSYQARDIKNPFTYEERHRVIIDWYHGAELDKSSTDCWPFDPPSLCVRPVRDQPYHNHKWVQSVQEQVSSALVERGFIEDECDIFITGSDRDDSTWYLHSFPQWGQDLIAPVPKGEDLNATGLRNILFSGGPIKDIASSAPSSTISFLKQFCKTHPHARLMQQFSVIQRGKDAWAGSPYPVIFQTVDAVVIQSGHVLVVERGAEPGKGLWALPGGFLNPNEWLIDASIRELIEETKIKVTENILRGSYVAREIFDDPNRSLRGRTITTAHLFRLDDTKPLPKVKGSDDAAKAFWIPISKARANSELWFEDHLAILDWAVGIKDKS